MVTAYVVSAFFGHQQVTPSQGAGFFIVVQINQY
jgi:hypothetical protein